MIRPLSILAVVLGVPSFAFAGSDPSPAEIAKRSLSHSLFALEGAEVKIGMTLAGPGANEQRSIVVQSKRVDGLLRSVTRFQAPASVAGTSFLSIQNDGRADDQYAFLPRLKNTRRVGSGGGDRDASFMGTDFTYDDLSRKSVRDATFKALPDEAVDGQPCYRIETTPKVASRYAKTIVWVRKSDFAPIRTESFAADGAPIKSVRILKTNTFEGRNVASEVIAEDLKTHHKTTIEVRNVRFDMRFADGDFTPAALSR